MDGQRREPPTGREVTAPTLAAGHAIGIDDEHAAPRAALEIEREAADEIGLGTHIGATIDWAVRVGRRIPAPGVGRTAERWSALATAFTQLFASLTRTFVGTVGRRRLLMRDMSGVLSGRCLNMMVPDALQQR